MKADLQISLRKLAATTLLISGTFGWFLILVYVYLSDIFNALTFDNPFWSTYHIGQILFFGSAVFFAILGSFISVRVDRKKFLTFWVSLGMIATILLLAFRGETFAIISSLLLGLSFGLGLPSSMAFLAECTVVEERARVAGAVILGTFVSAFIAIAIGQTLSLGIIGAVLVLAIVRSISYFGLALDNFEDHEKTEGEKSRLPHGAYKEFIFYLFPWIMFCIAGGIAFNLIPANGDYEASISAGNAFRYVFIAVFGLVSGFSADRWGRKKPIIAGLIILGLSFAILGFIFSALSVFLYLIISGVAWGAFFVVYLTIPGDLSVSGYREKFYALGFILPVASFFGWAAVPGWATFSNLSASSISLILSVILFLSIIPILRAKETLSGQKIRDRKMKEYVDKIGELIEESKEAGDR